MWHFLAFVNQNKKSAVLSRGLFLDFYEFKFGFLFV